MGRRGCWRVKRQFFHLCVNVCACVHVRACVRIGHVLSSEVRHIVVFGSITGCFTVQSASGRVVRV